MNDQQFLSQTLNAAATRARRVALFAAAIVPLSAALAGAQYRVDTGGVRDANNRLGSGGYNDGTNIINNRVGGLAGNYIVTGNVTGGRAFRGDVGYAAPTDFRGNLGSANFDNFIRDSTGVGQIRGDYGRNPNVSPQPYFGGGRTVAPPPGFIRDQSNNGAFVPAVVPGVLPNDGRIDYGGATRGQLAQALLDNRQIYGNASGIAPTSGQQFGGIYPGANDPQQLSEFTALARQRRGLFDGSGTADASVNDLNARPLDAARRGLENDPTNPNATPTANPSGPFDPSAPIARDPRDNRVDGNAPLETRVAPADPDNPASTGQGSVRRAGDRPRALDNNPQYAALRERLDQARRDRAARPQPGAVTTDPNAAERDGQSDAAGEVAGVQPIDAGAGVSTGQGRTPQSVLRPPTKKPDAAGTETRDAGTAGARRPGDAAGSNAAGSNTSPGVNASTATPPAPADGPTNVPAPRPAAELPNVPGEQRPEARDTLQLPRPAGDAAAPAVQVAPDGAPVRITSLASGVKDAELGRILTQAESLMKEGKFSSAIEAYDRAEDVASDDPLVFMGRSIAELGGGYYRKAEANLRQAFAADESLLFAKFDLRGMLGDERLNALVNDLNEVARTNANDPGPLLLVGFIYYNAGMEPRAARALDLAQTRAEGRDKEIELLRKNWKFEGADEGQNK